jgi:hypothetical protein
MYESEMSTDQQICHQQVFARIDHPIHQFDPSSIDQQVMNQHIVQLMMD